MEIWGVLRQLRVFGKHYKGVKVKPVQEEYLNKLIAVSENGIAPSTDKHRNLYYNICRHFGSWWKGLELANLKPCGYVSDEDLLRELRRRSRDGVAPRCNDDRPFTNRIVYRFSSWGEGVRRAGLRLAEERLQPQDYLLKLIRLSKDGVAPRPTDHPKLASNLRYHYGSWNKALLAACLKRYRKYNRADLIKELRRRAIGGIAPKYLDDRAFSQIIAAQFGKWSNGVKAAGLKRYGEHIPKEDCIRLLRACSRDGMAPVSSKRPKLLRSIVHHFGSWGAGVKAAGLRLYYRAGDPKVKKELLEELCRRMAGGRRPRAKDDTAFTQRVRRIFGSWTKALELAEEEMRERIDREVD